MKQIVVALTALAALGAAEASLAQAVNTRDQNELIISQIQTDKRAVVLSALQLTDTQVAAFTPIYDEYQREMKGVMTRGSDVINKFAANYGSMTDDAAKDIMKDFFKVRNERNALVEKYAKKLGRELPATKVLQWVQVENKLNTLLDAEAASIIPLSR
jgi:ribosome-binding ATPase YchF (GTP1/OBG family)